MKDFVLLSPVGDVAQGKPCFYVSTFSQGFAPHPTKEGSTLFGISKTATRKVIDRKKWKK
jgi:hypothetical protein